MKPLPAVVCTDEWTFASFFLLLTLTTNALGSHNKRRSVWLKTFYSIKRKLVQQSFRFDIYFLKLLLQKSKRKSRINTILSIHFLNSVFNSWWSTTKRSQTIFKDLFFSPSLQSQECTVKSRIPSKDLKSECNRARLTTALQKSHHLLLIFISA